MSTETASPFGSDQSSDDDSDRNEVHTGALASALRDTASTWGFGVLMLVFTGIALSTSVYTSLVYPVFFGLCALGTLAAAGAWTYSRYGHHRFEATKSY